MVRTILIITQFWWEDQKMNIYNKTKENNMFLREVDNILDAVITERRIYVEDLDENQSKEDVLALFKAGAFNGFKIDQGTAERNVVVYTLVEDGASWSIFKTLQDELVLTPGQIARFCRKYWLQFTPGKSIIFFG